MLIAGPIAPGRAKAGTSLSLDGMINPGKAKAGKRTRAGTRLSHGKSLKSLKRTGTSPRRTSPSLTKTGTDQAKSGISQTKTGSHNKARPGPKKSHGREKAAARHRHHAPTGLMTELPTGLLSKKKSQKSRLSRQRSLASRARRRKTSQGRNLGSLELRLLQPLMLLA